MKRYFVIVVCFLAGAVMGMAERQVDTVLPSVQYRDVRVDQAFEELSNLSRNVDPEGEGVNIVYRGPTGDRAPSITLSLRRVSLYDAIRYITQVAGLYYRIDEHAVFISDEPFRPDRIVTRFYPVQPTIMDIIRSGQEKEDPPPRAPMSF